MPGEISLTSMQIVTGAKIVFFATALSFVFLWRRFNRPWAYAALFTASVSAFYVILAAPLKTLIGGNTGDEQFITAFFTRVLDGQYFSDFYYRGLPPFYPPLYFWVVGTVSAPFVASGVGAAKIGAGLVFLAWFAAPYLLLRWFWRQDRRQDGEAEPVASRAWFWLLFPLCFLLTTDFYALMLKPYETISAMLAVCWLGCLNRSLSWPRWDWKTHLAFGLTGGLLFLTYYFWWFALIPAVLVLALLARPVRRSLSRCLTVGAVVFIVSLPYVAPLAVSFMRHGIENGQAFFFVIEEFFTYAPWASLSAAGILLLVGAAGLWRFRHSRFLLSAGVLLLCAYAYQAANLTVTLFGGKPAQAAKPFLFLGGAALSAGAAYAAVAAGERVHRRFGSRVFGLSILASALLFAPNLPSGRFIEQPKLHAHIENALRPQGEIFLAENVRQAVPDYRERVWLSSGTAALNGYLPLDYFLANNPHFSHQASRYSERFATVRALTQAADAAEFDRIIDERTDIDALLLFKPDGVQDSYPLLFWQDAFPNGGREIRLDLRRDLIGPRWRKVKEDLDWDLYVTP